MFWTIKVVIGDGERGLVYRNRRFQQILLPGVHRLSPFGGRPHVDIHTASKGAAYTGSDQDSLIEALGATAGHALRAGQRRRQRGRPVAAQRPHR
jgi:hypothetical protein